MPQKCKDVDIFTIFTFADAMLDLVASINVMPTFFYKSLKLGDLRPTKVVIRIANRSTVQPLGVLEDLVVKVNGFVFLEDFYILDMEDDSSRYGSILILRRPFLMTAQTKIDVHIGTLSM